MPNTKKLLVIFVIFVFITIVIPVSVQVYKKTQAYASGEVYTDDGHELTVNMAEIPQIPWDVKKAAVHVIETFTAAVHGSLAPYYFRDQKEPSNQNVLLESYSCEKLICKAILKRNMEFHNGRTVTAYDVEYSLIREILADPEENYAESILDDIEGINSIAFNYLKYIKIDGNRYPSGNVKGIIVKNEFEIEFHLKRENNFFFARISDGKLPIVPIETLKEDHLTWKQFPVGFGKYKVTNVDLAKHEYYLQKVSYKENIPNKVKLIFTADQQGDIKLLLGGPHRGNEEYEHRLVFSNPYSNGGFLFNHTTELGSNFYFRKAISYALDRNIIARASYFNELFPEDQLLPNSVNFKEYRPDLPLQSQNIELAKQYLAKVPKHLWQNKRFEIPVYWEDVKEIYTLPYIVEIKKQLAAVGLHVDFLNSDERFEKFNTGDTRVFCFTGFSFANKDPHKLFSYFRKGSYFKNEHPNNPLYETLYQNAVNNKDPLNTKPTKILGNYFFDESIMVVLFVQRMSLSYDPRVVISLGNQYNGTRFAVWEIKMRSNSLIN
ncbi:ABC transporter substrate-binding protein [Pigmentibacter sp. JX0631]|uniref:ABC transporter substrate-binding protein n=1 Tax=Pigmentibacter sp. JX0631 TaxID=2976982 RepID=UPI002469B4D6|nr:ABC transporter substrate-binding protein [Pigmentibacter sp. JX0631]WGL60999.1 ABC transporter substrate-binding protein [Pigmentibacter sp. JX0631]